jgi:hypothetical protein
LSTINPKNLQKLTAPITDIRTKKQSKTINIDDLPNPPIKKFVTDTQNTISGNTTANNRGRDARVEMENDLNGSFERDA